MDNEARERLKNIARNLVDSSFAKACDDSFTEEDSSTTSWQSAGERAA